MAATEAQARPAAALESLPWTRELILITAGLLLGTFVVALDSTVVGTALPTIARELGDFSLYPWIFSGYLLTSTTTVPIWGRLADLYGRRQVLMVGIAIFVIASVVCGLSPNMLALVISRTAQGIGAGCLLPVILTIVGDIFPVAQRARLQGAFSSVWAISSVVGPLTGALFVSTIGWRWIFGINLPIGIIAVLLLRGYRENREAADGGRIDPVGAVGLTVGIGLLLWGLGTGSTNARPNWALVAISVILLALSLLWEQRSSSPTVPLGLLRSAVLGPIIAISLLFGVVMFGATTFVPLFVQGGLGRSAYEAGAALAPLTLGWPVGSTLAGRLYVRFGYRPLMGVGAIAMVAGTLMLALTNWSTPWVGAASAVLGLGLGLISTPTIIVIQSSVPWNQRGAATAFNQFSRTIGGAIGVSLLGVLLQARLGPGAANPLRGGGHGAAAALAGGIETIFWVLVVVSVATLAGAAWIFLARREPAVSS
ncbi:MAG TPA: MDR family MFS transporter [Candidatus Dormibacteraeota bacterium]